MTVSPPTPPSAKPRRSLAQQAAIGAVRLYQYTLSPMIGPCCRYAPSCSHYTCEAIEKHGVLGGVTLGAARILRCHPWGGSGYDPVPETSPFERLWSRSFGVRGHRESS